jgi:hypothetical protein
MIVERFREHSSSFAKVPKRSLASHIFNVLLDVADNIE